MFTLFSGLTLGLIIHENVAFHKANEIVLTRSKWLSTFIIYLKPHENFLNRLSEDLGNARIAAHSIEHIYDFPSKQDYVRIIKGLNGEVVALVNDQPHSGGKLHRTVCHTHKNEKVTDSCNRCKVIAIYLEML